MSILGPNVNPSQVKNGDFLVWLDKKTNTRIPCIVTNVWSKNHDGASLIVDKINTKNTWVSGSIITFGRGTKRVLEPTEEEMLNAVPFIA